MSGDDLDAIGQIAEGALLGAAVEPAHGEKPDSQVRDGHFGGDACKNCGATVSGNYCANCGQKGKLHRTLTAFWHDLLHGALHFDGKTWRTLPKLIFKPGELTRRYIDGERARFVSPMALFLFSIFLMFAVFQMIGLTAPTQINTPGGLQTNMDFASENLIKDREAERESLQDPDITPEERTQAQARIDELDEKIAGLDKAKSLVLGDDDNDPEFAPRFSGTGIDFIDNGIVQKWRENPSLMVYKLQANSYKFSWLLIPLSVPFVWLLFLWKRRFKAYDHAIFVTYSLAFMSLLFLTLSVLGFSGVDDSITSMAAIFIPPIHIYKQLRRTYGLSRWGAFWRLYVLLHFIIFVIVMFLQMLLVLGAF